MNLFEANFHLTIDVQNALLEIHVVKKCQLDLYVVNLDEFSTTGIQMASN